MKLNNDQRIVMQALLDGKDVKINYSNVNGCFEDIHFSDIKYVGGGGNVFYTIEEPLIYVALFTYGSRTIALTEEEDRNLYDNLAQISDWVAIKQWK